MHVLCMLVRPFARGKFAGTVCQKRVGFRRCTRMVYTRRVVQSPTPPVRVVVEHESSVSVGVGVDGSDTVSIDLQFI